MLEISRSALALIRTATAAEQPKETCGLLFGAEARIERATQVKNVAEDPLRHFEIDPAALFAAMRAERTGAERLIGYWHSHPTGDPSPSETDLAMAVRDGRFWLIIGGDRIGIWRMGTRVEPVEWAEV